MQESLEALHLINSFQKVPSKQGQGAAGGRQNELISELFKTWQLGQPLIIKLPQLHCQIVTERNNAYLQTCPAILIRALCSTLWDTRRRLNRKDNLKPPFSVILLILMKNQTQTGSDLLRVCSSCSMWGLDCAEGAPEGEDLSYLPLTCSQGFPEVAPSQKQHEAFCLSCSLGGGQTAGQDPMDISQINLFHSPALSTAHASLW